MRSIISTRQTSDPSYTLFRKAKSLHSLEMNYWYPNKLKCHKFARCITDVLHGVLRPYHMVCYGHITRCVTAISHGVLRVFYAVENGHTRRKQEPRPLDTPRKQVCNAVPYLGKRKNPPHLIVISVCLKFKPGNENPLSALETKHQYLTSNRYAAGNLEKKLHLETKICFT